jgi:hypothetical protein
METGGHAKNKYGHEKIKDLMKTSKLAFIQVKTSSWILSDILFEYETQTSQQ